MYLSGIVAEWLGKGLQNLLHRFNSVDASIAKLIEKGGRGTDGGIGRRDGLKSVTLFGV